LPAPPLQLPWPPRTLFAVTIQRTFDLGAGAASGKQGGVEFSGDVAE
jgi:hypothetical protein